MEFLINDRFKKFKNKKLELTKRQIEEIYSFFKLPIKKTKKSKMPQVNDIEYNQWLSQNVIKHKVEGFSIVNISLKPPGKPPGDITSLQMNELSKISEVFSCGELGNSRTKFDITTH